MYDKNVTKKQHYLPQFYLKNFAGQNNFIQILDMERQRIGSPRPYQGVGYEYYFYAAKTGNSDEASQLIEEWLMRYENIISKSLPNIINKIKNHENINNDDKYILSALMCLLWLRSPQMRNKLNNMQEDIYKKMSSFNAKYRVDTFIKDLDTDVSKEGRNKMINMLEKGEYSLEFNNVHHLRFMVDNFGFGGPGFINLFFNQKWKIYIAKGLNRFITTDSPVAEWWPPRKIFYGPSFLEINKYFSLTPEILIELTYPYGANKVKRETIFSDSDLEVKILNIFLSVHAKNFVYFYDRSTLEELIKGRKNRGLAEQKYYDRFEKQWDIARSEGWG